MVALSGLEWKATAETIASHQSLDFSLFRELHTIYRQIEHG